MFRQLACFVVLFGIAACGRGSAGPTGGAGAGQVPVDVVPAAAAWEPVTRVLQVTGSLTADEEAEVAAETGGRVLGTPVERGARVEEGSPLVTLSQTEAEASLREAEANVAQIEVRLGVTGDQPLDVEKVPEVSNARAAKDLAEAEFNRIKKLYDEKVVSGSEYDQRRTQVELTGRQYDTARNSARQLYRSLEASRARLALARKTFADTTVRSPFAGFVVERKVSIGDFVTRGTKVATVVRIHPLRVELTVPEQYMAAVKPGLPLELEVDAYPGRTFKGQVRYVSPALRADQRALTVEALVPNADGTLRPGLFATAAIQQSGHDRALCVPSTAVRTLAGSTRVYVIKGERVEERMVTTGQKVGDATEIVNGLAEGDQVAGNNVERLVDGARVRLGRAPGVSTASNPSPKSRQEN
jgi:RND family efflux transporter MFP subunit